MTQGFPLGVFSREIEEDADLSRYTSFRTMSRARWLVHLSNREDMLALYDFCQYLKSRSIAFLILGGGSNTLFATDYFEGVVIINETKGKTSLQKHGEHGEHGEYGSHQVTLLSGEMVSPWSLEVTKSGTSTLLPWIGLPGTIGGAVVGNAGCFGLETKDILISCEILDISSGQLRHYSVEDLRYTYRHSLLKEHPELLVVSATFDLTARMASPIDARLHRKDKQPGGRSCGSFFANPLPEFAGALLEGVGAKRFSCGGVSISHHHANFFLNDGSATWQEIISLALHVSHLVFLQHHISLRHEVVIIGNTGITNLSSYETSKISLPTVSGLS